ncbi:MAG TPA: hypothetical protein VLK32_01120 [Bacillota bacterium]|nr:hypothetical protein [Bacillota bacterium]
MLVRERLERWRAFNRWEREYGELPASADALIRWYSEAWDLSRRHSPGWQDAGVDMAKIIHLRRIREAFARLGSDLLAPR